jgi:uncharacterized protein (TIGR02001 family)
MILLAAARAGPAAAQLAGRLSLQSGYELRGASIGGTRPVGELGLSYDFRSGVYLNGLAFGGPPVRDDPGLAGVVGDLGYARRLGSVLSVDGGVTHLEYWGVGPYGYNAGYTELYGGLASHHLSARLYFSPNYYQPGVRTLYGELNGNLGLWAGVRLNAHVGGLGYVAAPQGLPPARKQYDWLVGASRQFGALDVHLSASGGGPSEPYPYEQPPRSTAVIFGAGYTF